MKRLLALCAVSILALSGALPARAADKGGLKDGGVGDLEERLAEIEAMAVRHSNHKMSVVLYGQIDKGYLYTNNIAPSGTGRGGIVDNANSPSFVGVSGEAKLDKDWKAGFRVELGVDSRPALNLNLSGDASPVVRVATGWIETPAGTVTVGHGSVASDKTGSVSLANTTVASRMLSLAPISTTFLLGYDLPFSDIRRDMARWDSPTLFGFILSASVANGDLGSPINFGFNPQQSVDIALRWAGETKEAGGWRAAAAVSYRDERQSLSPFPILPIPFVRSTVTQGSASVMSMSTGLFLNLASGRVVNDALWGSFDIYQAQAGWEKTIFSKLGPTTLFVEVGEMRIDGTGLMAKSTPKLYGLGAVQAISGLSVDVYADWKRIDGSSLGGPSQADTFLGGFRVKF